MQIKSEMRSKSEIEENKVSTTMQVTIKGDVRDCCKGIVGKKTAKK